jgi:hypothetical protein
MFRVYTCKNCRHTDYASVEREDERNECSLCGVIIAHDPAMKYAVTVDEAMDIAYEQHLSDQEVEAPPRNLRGIGLKKRVYYIVESIIEMKRGRPARRDEILDECQLAEIPRERTDHFLHILEQEGFIVSTHEGYSITGGDF